MANFSLGLGRNVEKLSLPDKQVIAVIEGKHIEPIVDVPAAVLKALREPVGTPPLREIVGSGDTVAIIVSDVTRAWIHYEQLLPTMLNELNQAGVPDKDIFLLVALGAHRKHTDQENISTYGQEVVNRVRIVPSQAQNESDFVYVGTTSRGVDACLNKQAVGASKVILTGGIVYHLMAGFGGGRKGIMPGISSYKTIQGNHRFCLHDEVGKGISPDSIGGKTAGNNMHEDLMEIGAMLNPAFLFNVVLTAEGNFARFVTGHWQEAWEDGCKTVADVFGVSIEEKADLVIASAGGYPKDMNLYQGYKTIDNGLLACKEDGVGIFLLECPDIAEPPDFSGWFQYESVYDRELALRQGFTVPGFIALKLGLMAQKIPHIVVTLPENKEFIEKAGMKAVTSLAEAMALAETILNRKDYTIIVMPHAANTVPLLNS